ncbi:hypothetical protein GPJ56_008624 [Histomonas meleagridis]|uniref:uncharacterized protein n=1 Tax=Histomonas meleagridis TaxID=135588 RepID=UPI003559F2BE|nr:hypothetical protein GPJ56_008624 [Histomonas meleagridis]KAH0805799.1 hypothetical protein GO595_001438 [Histomonas meleagridis]
MRVASKKDVYYPWLIYFAVVFFSILLVRGCYKFEYIKEISTELPTQPIPSSYLCNMNRSSGIGSTARDVVLLFGSHFAPGLQLCIKSLRSTGCKARIILFGGSSITSDQTALNFFKLMNVELIPNCDEPNKREYVPHMLRYEYELNWLLKNSGTIDRVLHTDSFDVFFQGDPFSEHVPHDSLKFVVEPHQVRSCGWNYAWIYSCYGEEGLKKRLNNFIICSGSISGGYLSYVALLKLMISQKEWSTCYKASEDQAILNYLVWNQDVRNAGIKYSFTGCDDGFFTVQWCAIEKKVKFNEYGQAITEANTVPSYIHQYNRIQSFTDFLFQKCGVQQK